MSSLSKQDFEGALPYLLSTSKSESIIRDLLAFRLHEKFQGKHYAVAREWSYKKKQTKPRGRADIAIFASSEKGKNKHFKKPPIAILEAKMVAAPGKKGKSVIRHINSLADQLVKRKRWSNAERFGLLAVRIFKETYPNSTSAFDEVIGYRKNSLKLPPDLDPIVMDRAKDLRLSLVKQGTGTLICGEEKVLQARVSLKWWLFSL